jgi:RimJ/RimL family protein N-acetyltransferase
MDATSKFGWTGQKVRLVPLDRARHFDNALRWLNDPQVTQWLLMGDFPLTRIAEDDFFHRACRGEENEVIFAIETLGEEHIGFCDLQKISYRHGIAELGIVIGRPRLWNRGHGTDAIHLLTYHAFHVVGLRHVAAEIFAENLPSLRIFEKCGYQQVGKWPQRLWKRGAYRDMICVVALRDEWLPQHAIPPAATIQR